MTDDQYWTDDSGDRRWGMYYLNESGPKLGLYITSQDDRGSDYVGESSENMLRFFEPEGEDYERQPVPDEGEAVVFDTKKCSKDIFGVFVVQHNEVKGIYGCGRIDLSQCDSLDVGPRVVNHLRDKLEDD